MTFTGMIISTEGELLMYSMGQGRDLGDFLHAKGLGEEKCRENPMADKTVLADTTELSENLQSWCRSVIGGLHYIIMLEVLGMIYPMQYLELVRH